MAISTLDLKTLKTKDKTYAEIDWVKVERPVTNSTLGQAPTEVAIHIGKSGVHRSAYYIRIGTQIAKEMDIAAGSNIEIFQHPADNKIIRLVEVSNGGYTAKNTKGITSYLTVKFSLLNKQKPVNWIGTKKCTFEIYKDGSIVILIPE